MLKNCPHQWVYNNLICTNATVTMLIYTVIVVLHFNILLVFFSHHQTSTLSLFTILIHLFFSISLSLSIQLINPSTHRHNPAPSNHHHHNITIQNNPTSKSTKNQTHTHTDTPIETKRVLLQTCGSGSILGGQLEHVLVLVKEVGVYGSTGTISMLETACGDRCLWWRGFWMMGEAV